MSFPLGSDRTGTGCVTLARPPFASWSFALVLAAFLTFLAHALLIIPELNKGELNLDESGTFLVATRPFPDALTVPTTFHSQPPLFYLAVHAVAKLNESEPALRLLPWTFMLALAATLLIAAHELSPTARVIAASVVLLSDYGRHFAMEIRPYSMAAFLSLWSCLFFWRLAAGPTRARAAAFIIVTTLLGYTLAMATWIIGSEMVATTIVLGIAARRAGVRSAIREHRLLIGAMVIVVLLYLPYIVAVWRLNGTVGNPTVLGMLGAAFNPRYYFSGPRYLTSDPYGLGYLALAMAAYAVWQAARRRDAFAGFLILVVVLQIGLTHGFLAGRSPFSFRYLAPAFPALCVLIGIGGSLLLARIKMGSSALAVASAGAFAASLFSFAHQYGKVRTGPWRQVNADLISFSGSKVVFFDIGWDGERLQYESRHNPSVKVMTNPGVGLGTGGNILTSQYVGRVIRESAGKTSMFLYQYDPEWRSTVFDSAFAPAMARLGCSLTYRRNLPTYARYVPGEKTGAIIVGYACNGK